MNPVGFRAFLGLGSCLFPPRKYVMIGKIAPQYPRISVTLHLLRISAPAQDRLISLQGCIVGSGCLVPDHSIRTKALLNLLCLCLSNRNHSMLLKMSVLQQLALIHLDEKKKISLLRSTFCRLKTNTMGLES